MSALDVYLGSKELKRTIVERSCSMEIPLRYICKEIGIEYKSFMAGYINSSESLTSALTEDQFEAMLKLLGIHVRHQFIIDSSFDAEKTKFYLKAKHDKSQIKTIDEEEGDTSIFTERDH